MSLVLPPTSQVSHRAFASPRLRAIGSAAVIGLIVGVLQFAAARWPAVIDLTGSRSQTLAPQTRDLLRRLPANVDISIIAPTRPRTVAEQSFSHAAAPFRDLLERCRRVTPAIQWKVLDPDLDLSARRLAEEFPDLMIPGVVITLEVNGVRRHETLHVRDLAEIGTTRDRRPVLEFHGEQSLAAALSRLTGGVESTVIYGITGHGELDLADERAESRQGAGRLVAQLRTLGCRMESLDLGHVPRIPADAHLVFVAGGTVPWTREDVEKFRRYLGEGGRGLVLLDAADVAAGSGGGDPLEELLAELGVVVGRDRLVTAGYTGELEAASPVMPATADHPLVRSLPLAPVVMQDARSVRTRVGLDALVTQSIPLLVSHPAPRAWGETELQSSTATFDPSHDLPGPVAVACAVERHQGDLQEPVLVIVGDAEFANNRNLSAATGRSGASFLLATIHWLRGQKQLLADIPPQQHSVYQLTGTPAELQRVVWGTMLVVGAGLFAAATTTWVQRRV